LTSETGAIALLGGLAVIVGAAIGFPTEGETS
jgi:hypothetical protein